MLPMLCAFLNDRAEHRDPNESPAFTERSPRSDTFCHLRGTRRHYPKGNASDATSIHQTAYTGGRWWPRHQRIDDGPRLSGVEVHGAVLRGVKCEVRPVGVDVAVGLGAEINVGLSGCWAATVGLSARQRQRTATGHPRSGAALPRPSRTDRWPAFSPGTHEPEIT